MCLIYSLIPDIIMMATDFSVLLFTCLISVLVQVSLQNVALVRFMDRDLRNHSYVDFNLVRNSAPDSGADPELEWRGGTILLGNILNCI